MTKIIEVPGQGRVEFPDNMTDDQIVAAIKKISTPEAAPSVKPMPAAKPSDPRDDFRQQLIKNYADETDRVLGMTPGTSLAQLKKESQLNDAAVSKAGAVGVAQIMPDTLRAMEKRFGRKFDPRNTEDSLFLHREVMRENMRQFKNEDDALRAYNGGWDKTRWGNPETSSYVNQIRAIQSGKAGYSGSPYTVRKDVDIKSLNRDPDWVRASMMMYEFFENKKFSGSEEDAAEYGKNGIAAFNWDLVSMAQIAHHVAVNGSQEQKEAFLYMLETYDNTTMSWEGTSRALHHGFTDPTNLIGIGTLGVATIAKFAGREAAIAGAKNVIVRSLARSGITAGIDTAVSSAAVDATRQGIEVSAGRRESVDMGQVATSGAIGFVGGAVLGTAVDAAASKLIGALRGVRGKADGPVPGGKLGEAAVAPEAKVKAKAAEAEAKAAGAKVEAESKVPAVKPEAESVVAKAANDNGPKERDPNLGSTLTPKEIAEAEARRQPGRLPEDANVPGIPTGTRKIDVPEMNSTLRDSPRDLSSVREMAKPIVDQLRQVPTKDLPAVLEQVRNGQWNSSAKANVWDEITLMSRGLQDYADEITVEQKELIKKINAKPDAPEVPQLQIRLAELEARSSAILADDATGTFAGQLLRQRQETLGLKGITVESIMAEQKLPRKEAEAVWADMVGKAEQEVQATQIKNAYDKKAAEALERGDTTRAIQLTIQKNRELSALTEQVAPRGASFFQKLNEFAISNVFSVKTIMMNLIPSGLKTLVIPGIKGVLSNPFERATRAEMMGSYSAMRSGFMGALKAAKAAYQYEQAILTRDGLRLVEGELAMTGKLGGAWRVFPRILNASDEFLSRLNYDSFIAGRTAAETVMKLESRKKNKLTGKDFDAYVDKKVKEALAKSREITSGDDIVQPIINKGVNLGLTGDELFSWVEKEAMKNAQVMGKGSDEEALNFVRDVLYKRNFSGSGNASKAAQMYEETMNKFPSMKFVLGQLFFRTPIRVFEEGIRMTPGIQILAPNFLNDLAGKNGALRQVRAQGEAMTSLAIAGTVLSLYGQGRITGDGAYKDWKQQRTRTDGPLQEPYTIKMSDGSTWSYRSFDPLATPIKIMINGLERMDRLRIREAQGEFIDASLYDKAFAYVSVGTTAIAAAIRDANLVSGINTTISLAENLSDPEKKEGAWIKFVGERLFTLTPNTLHKIAKDNDPTIKDPMTFWQVVDQKLAAPFGQDGKMIKTAYSYDVLGNPRQLADDGALWNVFSTASVEERGKGLSKESQVVLAEMDRMARLANAKFVPPTKHKDLGDLDLRTIMASDGKRTLYDVWQDNYRNLNPDKALYPIAISALPMGTFKERGIKFDEMTKIINDFQDAAFYQMMKGEQKVIDAYYNDTVYKAKAKAGLFDVQ